MQTTDLLLYETGSGGDLAILNNDLVMAEALYQQVYLALFGGNVEANTKTKYIESEERFDYWGNSLIWNVKTTKQFNSETERALRNNALNSSGRLAILQAVNTDLSYLTSLLSYSVEVSVLSVNSLKITVNFTQKGNQQNKVLQLVYDNAKNELIIEKII
jgi:hypothetical protein